MANTANKEAEATKATASTSKANTEEKSSSKPTPAEFEYPEFTGAVATVRKKEPGTYEPLRGGLIRHDRPKKLNTEAEVERYKNEGFLEVRYTNEYLNYQSARQAAELAFLKKNK